MNTRIDAGIYPLPEKYLRHRVLDFVDVRENHDCIVQHQGRDPNGALIIDHGSRLDSPRHAGSDL